jgi:putative tryptophan/tyrosine transport system substrate-binding protein
MRRRNFITGLVSTTAAWPVAAHAQPAAKPVIGYIGFGALDNSVLYLAAFRKGLGETGYIEGQNVAIEYRWLEGRYARMPEVTTELVRAAVAVIATPGTPPSAVRAAMAVTTTIPIVFGVGDDPVKWGIVADLKRPNANATGINLLTSEVVPKRLELLRELVPNTARIAVLLNSADPVRSESTLNDVQAAARTLALQIQVLNASTSREIEAAFATLASERPDALFVAPDVFFNSRRVQLAMLAARHSIPSIFAVREYADAGGLMSYGTSLADMYRQVGVYTGRILKGAKPADLPVMQSVKFELVINASTARMLGLTVPDKLLAVADEVIE